MKTVVTLFIALFILLSCSGQKSRSLSQEINANPREDVFWNAIAMESVKSNMNILDVLADNDPALVEQIYTDSKDPLLPQFWGQSYNFDSNAKKTIVDEKIIKDLQQLFGIQNDNQKVHAGIIHTYGYLFSTIETPYGYKRKRWIEPTLNTGFTLTSQALSPFTIEGGMLSNITFFAGKLVFKSNERQTQLAALKNVANEVFTYDYSKLTKFRLEEETEKYVLVTTFVEIPTKNDENYYLLIYSTVNKQTREEKLITAFPVNRETFQKTTAPSELGDNKKITLRYNAYLGSQEQSFKGRRRLIKD
jgi:hypothetical protein